jgi:hypothetical protein
MRAKWPEKVTHEPVDVRQCGASRLRERWQARYFLDWAWHNALNTTTKTDANAWLALEQSDRSRGAWVDPKSGKGTLEA